MRKVDESERCCAERESAERHATAFRIAFAAGLIFRSQSQRVGPAPRQTALFSPPAWSKMTVRGFPESEGKGGASRWPSHSRSIALHRSFTVKPRADCSGPLTKVRVRPLSAQHTHAARKHAAYRVSQSERERELHTQTHTHVCGRRQRAENVWRAHALAWHWRVHRPLTTPSVA